MTCIQTFILEPGTPELAICARWRANAFSVLKASFDQELRSLELFASDHSHGAALVATKTVRTTLPSRLAAPTTRLPTVATKTVRLPISCSTALFEAQTGKHLLGLSLTAFDPSRILQLVGPVHADCGG
jgi:hypothetical protein